MARYEDDRDRDRWQGRERTEDRERGDERWRGRDWSGGGMNAQWDRDRNQGYGGGMGYYGPENRESGRWGARDQYGQGSEGWGRGGERWGGREQDLGRGESGGYRSEWRRDAGRGDEWRDWTQGRDLDRNEWGRNDRGREDWARSDQDRNDWNRRGSGQRWSEHTNWGEGARNDVRGREAGWGGYGSYDRERGGRYTGTDYDDRATRERDDYRRGYEGARWNERLFDPGAPNILRGREGDRGDTSDWNRSGGGYEGRHAGRGPRNYQRSDDRIREDVIQRLTDHPDVDASEIDVEVRNGEVTLRGSVNDRNEKHRAEDVTERVWGVRDVRNDIRVERQSNDWGQGGNRRYESEMGSSSGAASFHSGSTSYPTLTAPGGQDPNAGRSGQPQQTTGTHEGSRAGENQPGSTQGRQNIASGDQGTRNEQFTGGKK